MLIKIIDKLFWDYFKECPRKACLSFIKHNKFENNIVNTFKRLTIEQQKFLIFEKTTNKFFQTLTEKNIITVGELKTIFLIFIQKARESMKNNKHYSNEYKKEFINMTDELRTLDDFYKLVNMLEEKDAENFYIGAIFKINLKDFINEERISNKRINGELKNDYFYNLEIPFYKKTNDDKIVAIKYLNTGFPYDIPELNPELIILNSFFKKCTEEELDYTIVYDFKTMQRYEIHDLKRGYRHINNILSIIDNDFVYANNSYENCINCVHKSICAESKKYGVLFEVEEGRFDNKKEENKK